MYKRSLELYENVFTERTPRIRTWAITWSGGIPDPILVDQMNIDQLKTDLDGLLDHFADATSAEAYFDANGFTNSKIRAREHAARHAGLLVGP